MRKSWIVWLIGSRYSAKLFIGVWKEMPIERVPSLRILVYSPFSSHSGVGVRTKERRAVDQRTPTSSILPAELWVGRKGRGFGSTNTLRPTSLARRRAVS